MLSRQSISITFFVLASLFFLSANAQNSMGVGTDTPNQNAVLELISPTGNQGFLVPRYTTAERTATSFTINLTATENGLMVFDLDEGIFYVWLNTAWQPISNETVTAGTGISIDGSGVVTNTGDLDNTNEIQDLDLTANILTVTNNASATGIDLTPYLDNTNLTESEVDAFVANDGYLTAEVDGSTTNEIQDLDLTANILTVTNNASATGIDLTSYLDNTNLTESEVDAFVANNGYLTSEVQEANDVPFDPTLLGVLSSTDVQTALDDVTTAVGNLEGSFNDVGFPAGNIISDNASVVQALDELEGAIESPTPISLQDAYNNGPTITTDLTGPFAVTGSEAISLSAGSGQNLSLTTSGNILMTGGNASLGSTGNLLVLGTLAAASSNFTVNASGNVDATAGTFTNGLVTPSLTLSGTNSLNLVTASQTVGSANLTIPDLAGVNSTLALTSDLSLQSAYNNGSSFTTGGGNTFSVNGTEAITLGSSASNIALATAANLEFSGANFSLLATGDMNVMGKFNVNDGLTGNINPIMTIERTDGNSATPIQFLNADNSISIGMTTTEGFAISAPGNNIGLSGDLLTVTNAGDVGIGVTNPSAKLDVNGAAEINGALQAIGNVTANSYQFSSAITKRVTIGVHQFRPEIITGDDNSLIVIHGNGTRAQPLISSGSDPDAHLSAPVSLPNGATLTLFEAQLYQAPSSSQPVTMQLYRKTLAGAPELMSTVTYSTTPGTTQLVSDTDFGGFEVIDNTNYQYWLRFTGEGGDSLLSYTAGVRLTYTITSVD
ncbi:MAG: hypothetical protein JXR03_13995 [Cyclobacteriaceae bacterium]